MDERTDSPLEAESRVERLAAILDDMSITVELLAADFPQWRVWYSEVTGCFHARRKTDWFVECGDGRNFHVAALTAGRLAVLLLHQAALDAEENSRAGDHSI